MRVLFNAMQAGNQSGTGRYVEELLRALVLLEGDHELTVWWPADVPYGDWSVDVELVRQPRGIWHRIQRERALRRVQKEFDVIHFPASIGPMGGGHNVVVTVHDCIFLRHPKWFRWERALYYRWAGRRSARRSGHVIADSEYTAHDLAELMEVSPPHVSVVPLGVSENFAPQPRAATDAFRERNGFPKHFFLYVGTLEPRKNLARLVRAWNDVADDIREDLVIAGRAGWKPDEFNRAIAGVRHEKRIHCPGYITSEDLPLAYSAARGFVWPSLYEGFGLPVLEAMACGTPTITSNTTSLPEVVGDGALLVDPSDQRGIAEAMVQVSTDDGLCARLSEAGRRRAATFTWTRCAEETLAVYRQVAK
jgi:glycosyltransferase involved in cell wall biosynthesis